MDRHVQIKPGPTIVKPMPKIGVLGGIAVSEIGNINGMTTHDASFVLDGSAADSLGRPCPFGKRVVVQGPTFPGMRYRVQVKKVSDPPSAWSNVTTKLRLTDVTGTVITFSSPVTSSGYFNYIPSHMNVDNVLAWWDTSGDDLWQVKLDIQGVPGFDMHRIQLDNTAPVTDIHIDSGGDCKDFTVNSTITGKFVARDTHLGFFNIRTLPFAAPTGQLVPSDGNVQTATAPGDTWTLDTKDMAACGYVVRVHARDRAILRSAPGNHNRSSSSVGFCLREKK